MPQRVNGHIAKAIAFAPDSVVEQEKSKVNAPLSFAAAEARHAL